MGVDRAVFYFLTGRVFSTLAMPATFYLIASKLSVIEQGYYFTFSSLLGLSIFFELGLGVVICQFASHEYANLTWHSNGKLVGEAESLARILSLLRKSLQWYGVVTLLFAAVLIPSVLHFLSGKPDSGQVDYLGPWVLLIVFFSFNTFLIPVFSIIEGCGRVAEIQKMRAFQTLIGTVFVWLAFLGNGKLYAIAAEFFGYGCLLVMWLAVFYRGLLHQIFFERDNTVSSRIVWFKEVLPMQWRISVSWIAVYFTNYFIVPMAFAYLGAADAGKIGLSLKISTMVFTFSMAWVNTRIPAYGALIQQKKINELDDMAIKSTKQATFAGLLLAAVIVGVLSGVRTFAPEYDDRVLSDLTVAILCLGSVAMMINSAIAGYLRAYKQEPLMTVIVVMAIISVAVCYAAAKYFDANVMATLYSFVYIFVGIPAYHYVLRKKRNEWQMNDQ